MLPRALSSARRISKIHTLRRRGAALLDSKLPRYSTSANDASPEVDDSQAARRALLEGVDRFVASESVDPVPKPSVAKVLDQQEESHTQNESADTTDKQVASAVIPELPPPPELKKKGYPVPWVSHEEYEMHIIPLLRRRWTVSARYLDWKNKTFGECVPCMRRIVVYDTFEHAARTMYEITKLAEQEGHHPVDVSLRHTGVQQKTLLSIWLETVSAVATGPDFQLGPRPGITLRDVRLANRIQRLLEASEAERPHHTPQPVFTNNWESFCRRFLFVDQKVFELPSRVHRNSGAKSAAFTKEEKETVAVPLTLPPSQHPCLVCGGPHRMEDCREPHLSPSMAEKMKLSIPDN